MVDHDLGSITRVRFDAHSSQLSIASNSIFVQVDISSPVASYTIFHTGRHSSTKSLCSTSL